MFHVDKLCVITCKSNYHDVIRIVRKPKKIGTFYTSLPLHTFGCD